jgi:PAS domain S-box-containing protein
VADCPGSGQADAREMDHLVEIEDLRIRLRDAEDALDQIRGGGVDAVIVGGPLGQQIYTITNADRPYRILIEQMKEGAVTLSNEGLVLYCNEAFALLLERSPRQVSGKPFAEYLTQADIQSFEAMLDSSDGGRAVVTMVTSRQTEVPVNLSLSPLPDDSGARIVCGVVTDLRPLRQSTQQLAEAEVLLADQIAERERTEALLHQAQKMEVVGQLTGGLAHDFNNLLMIISGNLDLIRRRASDEKMVNRLDQVLLAVRRGAKLTQQLLAFSRIQSLSPESICINDLLPEIEMLVRRAVGSEIEVHFDLVEGLWSCRVDPNQLESAILNLAINARDAMRSGGGVRIATENLTLDRSAATALGEIAPGKYVAITLSDTGSGMPPAVLSRVFEPFFTTKEVGKGSGLGLSQVYGFARQSGGHITIESEVDRGTAVRLYLPWTEPVHASGAKLAETVEPLPPGRTKILIVEDDNELRELHMQLVEALGYTACTAGTGAEAIAMFERDAEISLLFTDILMPGGMNGYELAAEIRRRRPDMAILTTSGFPGNFLPDLDARQDDFHIIRKPFTQTELAAALLKVRVTGTSQHETV